MDLICYICDYKHLEINKIIHHLKTEHLIKERVTEIKCVAVSSCEKTFHTFSGLKKHVGKCIPNDITDRQKNDEIAELCIEFDAMKTENISKTVKLPISGDIDFSVQGSNTKILHIDEIEIAQSMKKPMPIRLQNEVAFKGPEQLAHEFLYGILQTKMNQSQTNNVFKLTTSLIEEIGKFYCESVDKHSCDATETIESAGRMILSELNQFDSAHKRQLYFEKQETFVKPVELTIGTHWQTRRQKSTNLLLSEHVQSTFGYVSPLQTIKALFSDPEFLEMYLGYNDNGKHMCEDDVYMDFCCGSVFKGNELFRKHPNSIQIQLFFDGFEICDPLKSRSNKYNQLGVYFTIRNLPPQFAYCLSNIHTVALVNESDLKKSETDYTNIFEVIVRDVQVLETTGIDINPNLNLKGIKLIIQTNISDLLIAIWNFRNNY